MADKTDKNGTPLPPYISYQTFTNFISKLKETVVPPRVDGSVLTSYAGSVARQLVLALKYLKLIQQNGTTTPLLKKVVENYGTEHWKDVVGDMISDAYSPVIGELNTDEATYQQLEERFREAGADGVVRDRAINFYLAAFRDAGWTYSPHFNRPRRSPVTRKPKGAAKKSKREEENNESEPKPQWIPGSTIKFLFPIPDKVDAVITVPKDISKDDWDMITIQVGAYISRMKKS